MDSPTGIEEADNADLNGDQNDNDQFEYASFYDPGSIPIKNDDNTEENRGDNSNESNIELDIDTQQLVLDLNSQEVDPSNTDVDNCSLLDPLASLIFVSQCKSSIKNRIKSIYNSKLDENELKNLDYLSNKHKWSAYKIVSNAASPEEIKLTQFIDEFNKDRLSNTLFLTSLKKSVHDNYLLFDCEFNLQCNQCKLLFNMNMICKKLMKIFINSTNKIKQIQLKVDSVLEFTNKYFVFTIASLLTMHKCDELAANKSKKLIKRIFNGLSDLMIELNNDYVKNENNNLGMNENNFGVDLDVEDIENDDEDDDIDGVNEEDSTFESAQNQGHDEARVNGEPQICSQNDNQVDEFTAEDNSLLNHLRSIVAEEENVAGNYDAPPGPISTETDNIINSKPDETCEPTIASTKLIPSFKFKNKYKLAKISSKMADFSSRIDNNKSKLESSLFNGQNSQQSFLQSSTDEDTENNKLTGSTNSNVYNSTLILKAINKRKFKISCPLCSSKILNMSDHLLKKHSISDRNQRKNLMDMVRSNYISNPSSMQQLLNDQSSPNQTIKNKFINNNINFIYSDQQAKKIKINNEIQSTNIPASFSTINNNDNSNSILNLSPTSLNSISNNSNKSNSSNGIPNHQNPSQFHQNHRKSVKCPICVDDNKYFVNISDHLIKIHHLIDSDQRKPILRQIKQDGYLNINSTIINSNSNSNSCDMNKNGSSLASLLAVDEHNTRSVNNGPKLPKLGNDGDSRGYGMNENDISTNENSMNGQNVAKINKRKQNKTKKFLKISSIIASSPARDPDGLCELYKNNENNENEDDDDDDDDETNLEGDESTCEHGIESSQSDKIDNTIKKDKFDQQQIYLKKMKNKRKPSIHLNRKNSFMPLFKKDKSIMSINSISNLLQDDLNEPMNDLSIQPLDYMRLDQQDNQSSDLVNKNENGYETTTNGDILNTEQYQQNLACSNNEPMVAQNNENTIDIQFDINNEPDIDTVGNCNDVGLVETNIMNQSTDINESNLNENNNMLTDQINGTNCNNNLALGSSSDENFNSERYCSCDDQQNQQKQNSVDAHDEIIPSKTCNNINLYCGMNSLNQVIVNVDDQFLDRFTLAEEKLNSTVSLFNEFSEGVIKQLKQIGSHLEKTCNEMKSLKNDYILSRASAPRYINPPGNCCYQTGTSRLITPNSSPSSNCSLGSNNGVLNTNSNGLQPTLITSRSAGSLSTYSTSSITTSTTSLFSNSASKIQDTCQKNTYANSNSSSPLPMSSSSTNQQSLRQNNNPSFSLGETTRILMNDYNYNNNNYLESINNLNQIDASIPFYPNHYFIQQQQKQVNQEQLNILYNKNKGVISNLYKANSSNYNFNSPSNNMLNNKCNNLYCLQQQQQQQQLGQRDAKLDFKYNTS